MSRGAMGPLLLGLAAMGCAPTTDTSPAPDQAMSGGEAPASGGAVTGGDLTASGGSLGGGGAPGSGGMTPGETRTVNTDIPCDVAQVLLDRCWKCHDAQVNWGAPMALATKADFAAMGKLTTTALVSDLVDARIHDATRPMPPLSEGAMPDAEKQVLSAWLGAGQPTSEIGLCTLTVPKEEEPMGTGGATLPADYVKPSWPGGVMPEETCYQFLKHGGQTPGDTTPHPTLPGEKYTNFYYKVPWTEEVVMTRWRTIYDRTEVLHHWLLYQSLQPVTRDGQWEDQIGTHPGTKLLAVWAAGGGDESFPDGVGLQLPGPGSMFEIEWHLYNNSGAVVPDRSGIEVCVVPKSKADPRFIAGVTWLGTEAILGLAPGAETKLGGTCTPSFKNGGPIHIVKWMPHMHLIGKHMDSWVLRADGSEEHVFSEPFVFDQQIMYDQDPPVIMRQGDRIQSQCTWRNTTALPVTFGQPTSSEMCYQFAFSYPIGSLDAAVSATLTGSDNACLGAEGPKL